MLKATDLQKGSRYLIMTKGHPHIDSERTYETCTLRSIQSDKYVFVTCSTKETVIFNVDELEQRVIERTKGRGESIYPTLIAVNFAVMFLLLIVSNAMQSS